MDVALIVPEPGQQKVVGKQLLMLAVHPSDVQWVTWPQAGFTVPLELLERFENEQTPTVSTPPTPVVSPAEMPKRRGRPPKTVSNDNATLEEE